MSTRGSVELIRWGKDRHINVTAEVCQAIGCGDENGRVSWTARLPNYRNRTANGFLRRRQNLADREAVSRAQIHRDPRPAALQVLQSFDVRFGQIRHMYVIPDAGSVRRLVVGAVDLEPLAHAKRSLDRDLDEVRGAHGRLAGAQLRVCAGDVEVSERHRAKAVGP